MPNRSSETASRDAHHRAVGVAYLTLAPLPAPESVMLAARAGYDFVGLRVKPFDEKDPNPGIPAGSPLLRETRRRLDDTGLAVLDIELILLTDRSTDSDWLPALEAGAELGGSLLSVAVADSDSARVADNLAALVSCAASYGIRPALEPISYQRLRSVTEAIAVAEASGAAVVLDPLHLTRAGDSLDSIRGIDPGLVAVVQLCDAPLVGPEAVAARAEESRFARLPAGQGGLPLDEFLAAAPPSAPISVEVPSTVIRSAMPDAEFAAMNLRAARTLIDHAERNARASRG